MKASLQRCLKYLPESPLLAVDSWGLRVPLHTELENSVSGSRVAQYILTNNYKMAWREIEQGIDRNPMYLSQFKSSLCSRFLAVLPDGSFDSKEHFPKAWKFSLAMKTAGLELTALDYSNLINLMLKSHQYHEIQLLWDEIHHKHPEMLANVNLWNAYIKASCQAYPLFWPISRSKLGRLGNAKEPPMAANVVEVLQKMEVNGVVPNARTYEHVLLSFARQQQLGYVQSIIEKAWLSTVQTEGSLLYPAHSTLAAIIEAYAFNGQVSQGIEQMLKVQQQYNIPLAANKAIHMWVRTLRHVSVNSGKNGLYDKELFKQVWQLAESHNVQPNAGMLSLRVEYFTAKGQLDELAADIPLFLEAKCDGNLKVAKSALTRVVKGYTNAGRALEALALLEEWASKGLDLRLQLQQYVRRRSGMTVEQLQMYKEDDDDDNWGI